MVESTLKQENPEAKEEVLFYEKSSGFVLQNQFTTASSIKNHLNQPLHFPLKISQNKSFPSELMVANTDGTLQILNMESGQIISETTSGQKAHDQAITALHCPQK